MARSARGHASTRSVGLRVEARVVRYLRRRGLKSIATNVGCRHGEIDLVALDGDCLVFVEVRYRGPGSRIESTLTVDRHKQRRIVAAAAWFLSRHPAHAERVCRFDVVGVDRGRLGGLKVNWIRDAFRVD